MESGGGDNSLCGAGWPISLAGYGRGEVSARASELLTLARRPGWALMSPVQTHKVLALLKDLLIFSKNSLTDALKVDC